MIKTKIQKIITKILVAWRQKKSKQNSRKQQKFKNQLNTTHIHTKKQNQSVVVVIVTCTFVCFNKKLATKV